MFDRSKPQYENEVQEREERQASRTVPTDLSGYEPAANWDGLEMVGGWGNWWKENWDPEHPYIGFAEGQAVTDSFEATAALRRAVIESFTLQQAGRSLSEISKLQTEYDPTYEVEIAASGTGATVQFPANAPVENVLVFKPEESAKEFDETKEKSNPTPSEEDVAADRSIADPLHPESTKPTPSEEVVVDGEEQPGSGKSAQFATYDELVASWNPAWLEISLANQELKFAVSHDSSQALEGDAALTSIIAGFQASSTTDGKAYSRSRNSVIRDC